MKVGQIRIPEINTTTAKEPAKAVEALVPANALDTIDRMEAKENYYRDLFHPPVSESLSDKLDQLGDHQMTGMALPEDIDTARRYPDSNQPNNPIVNEERGSSGYWQWRPEAKAYMDIEDGSLKAGAYYLHSGLSLERYANYSVESPSTRVGGQRLDVHADVDFSGGGRVALTSYHEISIGQDTYIESGSELFIGLVARMEGSLGVGEFYDVYGGVQGYAGFGYKWHLFAGFEDGKIKIDTELGIALGLGMGMDVGLEINPAAYVDGAANIVKQGADVAGDVGEWLGDAAANTFGNANEEPPADNDQWADDANNAIDQAADTAHAAVDFIEDLLSW